MGVYIMKKTNEDIEIFTMLSPEHDLKKIKQDIKTISSFKINESVIGTVAIILGIVSFLPILYKIWKTKDTRNFTVVNLTLALISNSLWIYYGNMKNASANIWSGILYFSMYAYIMIFKIFYK